MIHGVFLGERIPSILLPMVKKDFPFYPHASFPSPLRWISGREFFLLSLSFVGRLSL